MAPEWAVQLGMESAGLAPAAATVPAYIYGIPAAETLRVDDLLDFTNHDILPSSSSSSSSVPATDASLLVSPNHLSSEAAFAFAADNAKPISFPDDIYIPSEEVAELEWLSKFVEDSFSDVPIQSIPTDTMEQSMMNIHRPVASAAAAAGRGARSKRSRGFTVSSIGGGEPGGGMQHHTIGSAWASPPTTSSSSSSELPTPKGGSKKKEAGIETGMKGGGVRRCTHCASEKTPQWRTGPLGPKTLCNACGVRYKSGRLVPEYRPAASPTFVLTQHSNSHRKVMELRRQKELLVVRRQEGASSRFSSAAGRPQIIFHEFEIC